MREISVGSSAVYGLMIGFAVGAWVAVIATLVVWATWQLTVAVFAGGGAAWGVWSAWKDRS